MGTLADQNARSLGVGSLEAELHAFQPKTAQVILSNEQIKALPSTPVVLVAATETPDYGGFPSKLFFPTKVYGILDSRGGAYENVTNGCPFLTWGSDWSKIIGQVAQANWGNNPLTLGASNVGGHLFADFTRLAVFSMLLLEDITGTDDLYDNAVALSMTNSGNLTGGDPDNTLKMVIEYFELSIP